MSARSRIALSALVLVAALATHASHAKPAASEGATSFPLKAPDGWRMAGHDGVRGITIGPIENAYHPGVGYGSAAYARTLDECLKAGATWVAITPFGRVGDLAGRGVDP